MRAILSNHVQGLSSQELTRLCQPLPKNITHPFMSNLVPSVFSTCHGQWLLRIHYWSAQVNDPVTQALGQLLLWHLAGRFVIMSSSIGTANRPYAETLDGLRDWQDLNPKRFTDGSFQKLLVHPHQVVQQCQQHIKGGIFGGVPVECHQEEICTLLPQIQADIVI